MPWLQLAMNLGRIEPDILQDVLESIGAVAISFSNAGSDPVLEPAPGSTPLWARTRVSALLPTSLRRDAVADEIQTRLTGADFNSLEFSVIPDHDWQQEWKRHARPRRFGKRLRVCPSTPKKHEAGWAEVVLEPGLAFGTGAHESTAMCLEWLASTPLEGKTVLDFGCGSGVLAISALALGARSAVAVDRDDQALQATRANASRNACGDRLRVLAVSDLPANAQYDVLLANILSTTLIDLAPTLNKIAAPGAGVILSGILDHQSEEVRLAYANWLELSAKNEQNGWILLTGARAH